MCAIAGLIGVDYDCSILDKMGETMLRRGPDGNGVYTSENCALLHSRLAIIDPEGGAQPMTEQQGEKEYVIVYNGELYNTAEVRGQLRRLGHQFRTHSDTEVVLHAYIQWKDEAPEKLNGIFAFAVWEVHNQRLFLARDRMGVKPLFFKIQYGGILFASELKTILAYPTVRAELDDDGVAQIVLLGPGRTPGSGVFRGIQELEPGCCGSFIDGRWHCRRYWSLRDREHTESFAETVEHVRYLVQDAIRRQMVSDVPIGCFLSGGLDSSIICAVCNEDMRDNAQTLKTFSVDYKDNSKYFIPGKFQPNTDNYYIDIMRAYLQADHHWSVLTPEDLISRMEAATSARDLPGMADVDFSLLRFCEDIRKHVKVALSGECADEIFGGYPWYRDPDVRMRAGFPWAQNTKQRVSILSREYAERIDHAEYLRSRYEKTIAESDILPGTDTQERRMKEMVNLNQKWFMQTLLDRKDRMSMYCGLEVRVPFCDHRIAEYMYGVPWEFKDYNSAEKGLLRCAVEGILPQEILWRKKSPYPKTYDPHYLDLVSSMIAELLQRKDAPIFQIIRPDALIDLFKAESPWPWYGQLMKIPQTMAYMLQVNMWLEMYNVTLV